MSARLLKKVLKEQEAASEQLVNSGDDSESPDSSVPSRNPFDLLDEEENLDVEQEKEDTTGDESAVENTGRKYQATDKAVSNPKSSKKKKKKKIKQDFPPPPATEIDGISSGLIKLENLHLGASSYGHEKMSRNSKDTTMTKQRNLSILQVDPKFLNAENELRRIFGSKVVNSFERTTHQAGSSRQTRGGRRGSHNNHSRRTTVLVSPTEHWPRWDGSLSMELLETKDGVNYFRYVHSSSYSQTQRAFEAAKAMHDLNGIASILLYHPYHIDSLITMAEYFKFSGEHQMAADATAKCLYALECAWHPMFSPLQGNCCQLKYCHDTNKPFFSALFSHMKSMDRRGCLRSALEICKLLLSVDSDDPMGAMFCIDYFSLRAEEYTWLQRFSEEYNNIEYNNSLWLFPNFSYSLAVCQYHLERDDGGLKDEEFLDKEKASSSDLMEQALMLHPSVLKKLVAKVPLKDALWNKVLKNKFFSSEQTGSPTLDHLINIYVERSYLLWRLPDLQKFLRDSALSVIESLENKSSDAKDWACVRREAFSSQKNEYSHLLVSDFSDSVPTMPPEILQNFVVDQRGGVENMEPIPNLPHDHNAPPDLTNQNALAVLLESLLPWVNYGRGDREDDVEQHHEQGNRD